jgi:hypothetical protein
VILDTFHDRRSAFLFRTNPLGTQYDALVTDEGRITDVNWDEQWNSAARITDTGWSAANFFFLEHFNAFAPGDWVQVSGGVSFTCKYFFGPANECGPAGRTQGGAVKVNTGVSTGPMDSHSDLWRLPGVWESVSKTTREEVIRQCKSNGGSLDGNRAACRNLD